MVLPIGVLLSGTGTNLQAIIDRIEQGALAAEIRLVLSDNSAAYGLERAKQHGISTQAIENRRCDTREAHEYAVICALKDAGVEVVLLAGYMRLVSKYFIQAFPQKILNIHPSLLPAFPGLNAQQQAVDYGVRISGATVHFVDEFLDHGPIIVQAALLVDTNEGAESLRQRILKLEHRIYPQAVQWIAQDLLSLQGRHVYLRSSLYELADIKDLQPCLINPPLQKGF